jgi:serine/threonine-protein kinase
MTSRVGTPLPVASTHEFLAALRTRGLGRPTPRPDTDDATVPETLGQYRLLEPLGKGGMGQVYKAEHLVMKRLVALKLVAPHLVEDADAVARFHAEVQAAARLSHPNVVTAHDAAEFDGRHFLVLEYVDGIDLGRLVQQMGPLPGAVAAECIRQAALGLQHAHEHGLVHCDVKPCNLLLSQADGTAGTFQVKLLDFGLARLAGTTPESPTYPSLPPSASGVAGTPDFMAPEQFKGRPNADIRSDLYSLGCTFYFLLTGRVPFPGGAWSEKVLRHQFNLPRPVSDLRPDVPPAVEAIVLRLLAKDPDRRYPVPAALAEVLEVWLSDQNVAARLARTTPPEPPRTPPAEAAGTEPASTVAEGVGEEVAPVHDLENVPQLPGAVPEAVRRPRRRRPSLATCILLLGLTVVAAWTARHLYPEMLPEQIRPTPIPQRPVRALVFTLASAPGNSFDRLEAAVAAARDGDTVEVHGEAPLRTGPLTVRGKALTLRAAAGSRPRLLLAPAAVARLWQPFLTTDAALTVEGLELAYDLPDTAPEPNRAAHLVYSEGAPLRLVRCRLLAPRGCDLVVCRRARRVELRDCTLAAWSVAVGIEADAGPSPEITLVGNDITIQEYDGAALSLWGAAREPMAAFRLQLGNNTVRAGRVVALAAFDGGVDVTAHDNRFTFRQAFLSAVGGSPTPGWRTGSRWQGRNNRYHGSADWLTVDGGPGGVRGLAGWRAFWQTEEAGSVEDTAALPARPD